MVTKKTTYASANDRSAKAVLIIAMPNQSMPKTRDSHLIPLFFVCGNCHQDNKKAAVLAIAAASLPKLFVPYRYHEYSDESRSRKSHTGAQGMAHAKMGFDSREGGVVVARPDVYVGCLVKLVEGRRATEALEQYFSGFVPSILINEPI